MKSGTVILAVFLAVSGTAFANLASAQTPLGGPKKQTAVGGPAKQYTIGGPVKPSSPVVPTPKVGSTAVTPPSVPPTPSPLPPTATTASPPSPASPKASSPAVVKCAVRGACVGPPQEPKAPPARDPRSPPAGVAVAILPLAH